MILFGYLVKAFFGNCPEVITERYGKETDMADNNRQQPEITFCDLGAFQRALRCEHESHPP